MNMITYSPNTQKAKGINELAWNGFAYLDKYVGASNMDGAIYPAESLTNRHKCDLIPYPRFARPCPMLPRHGFVESRVVHNTADLLRLAEETLAAEDQAEIVLMDHVDATHSAILQEGRLTVGEGNDGATAGRDAVTVYLRGDGHLSEHAIVARSGVLNSPYIELVYADGKRPKAVQLRDGPKLPRSVDNVPIERLVDHVLAVVPDEDGAVISLLAWERMIKAAGLGTVVYHPGGSLSSHYSIHAVTAGIPVMISREPVVGETLEVTKDAEVPSIDWVPLRSAFMAAIKDDMSMASAMRLVLAVSKNIKSPTSYVLGYAMGLCFRLSLTACVGESRHLRKDPKKNYDTVEYHKQRNKVYTRVWERSDRHKRSIGELYDSFMEDDYPVGFGGPAWASVAHAAYSMYQGIAAGDVEETLFEFNKLVDAHHNNDWFGNKFIQSIEFQRASDGYYGVTVKSATALYRLLTGAQSVVKWNWKPLPPLQSGKNSGEIMRVIEIMGQMEMKFV